MFIPLPGIADAEEIIARIRIPQPTEAEDNNNPAARIPFSHNSYHITSA